MIVNAAWRLKQMLTPAPVSPAEAARRAIAKAQRNIERARRRDLRKGDGYVCLWRDASGEEVFTVYYDPDKAPKELKLGANFLGQLISTTHHQRPHTFVAEDICKRLQTKEQSRRFDSLEDPAAKLKEAAKLDQERGPGYICLWRDQEGNQAFSVYHDDSKIPAKVDLGSGKTAQIVDKKYHQQPYTYIARTFAGPETKPADPQPDEEPPEEPPAPAPDPDSPQEKRYPLSEGFKQAYLAPLLLQAEFFKKLASAHEPNPKLEENIAKIQKDHATYKQAFASGELCNITAAEIFVHRQKTISFGQQASDYGDEPTAIACHRLLQHYDAMIEEHGLDHQAVQRDRENP